MDIHPRHSKAQAYDKHAGHSVQMFRNRFWVSLILSLPVVLYSDLFGHLLNLTPPGFPGSDWIPFVLGTAIFASGGWIFLKGAWGELKARLPGMMTLIALAISAAYLYSVATTFFITGEEFFWELATLVTVMLFGHWMEMRSIGRAQGALAELAKLLPDTAELVTGEGTKVVAAAELAVGDVVLVRPGGKIPADGVVKSGRSSVNESMISGESQPVNKQPGSQVIAGAINGEGSLRVKVAKVGESTALAGIMRLVAEAQASGSRSQVLADRAAFYLTVIALVTGTLTLGWWLIAANFGFAVERAVTVLVIACPHALGMAIPLVTSISTTLGARNGLLVRQRLALESARNIDVVVFDKTGTLTQGKHGVIDVWPAEGITEPELLQLAAAVESESEHAIARAVAAYARQTKIPLVQVKQFKALPGRGAEGMVDGRIISVGGPVLLGGKNAVVGGLKPKVAAANAAGKTVIYVLEAKRLLGVIALADLVRSESKQAAAELVRMGVRVAMLTGDSRDVAAAVAKELSIKDYFAEVLPQHKADKVKELQADGSRVAMVGDGVNDAPALAAADIGVAIGAGTDVAIESAGIVLIKNDPRDVAKVIRLSRAAYSKMVQNLAWATGYNVIAIPLAAGVLVGQGLILPPAIGALLMSVSTIVVAVNSQLLRRLRLTTG